MNPGLRYLLVKSTAGTFRRLRRRVRGGRGVAALIGVLILIGFLIVPQIVLYFEGRTPESAGPVAETIRLLGPIGLLLFTLLTAMRAGVYFKRPEIQFLFPAPIGRRELLVYDAFSKLRMTTFSALWVAIFIARYAPHWYAAVAAAILAFAYLQLSAQAVGLSLAALEARFGKPARRLVMLAVIGLLLAGVAAAVGGAQGSAPGGGFLDVAARFAALPPVDLLSWIARPFVEIYLAESVSALALWALVSIGVLGLLLGLEIILDVAYTEGALETAQKIERRLARVRSGGGAFAAGAAGRGLHLPRIPYLGGAGPIAWPQLQELTRNYRGALMLGVVMTVMVGAFMLMPSITVRDQGPGPTPSVPAAVPMIMILIFMPMMTMNLAFDFRRDLDRMPLLKSLPVSGVALAAGQVLPTVLLLTFWELIGIAVIAAVSGPIDPALVAGVVLALVPLNAVLVALDNVLFLLMPYRIVTNDPGRMPFAGRLMIVMFLKMLLLFLLAGLAAIPAVIVLNLSRGSVLAAAAAVAAFLVAALIPMLWAVAAAFKRFDVSQDVPE